MSETELWSTNGAPNNFFNECDLRSGCLWQNLKNNNKESYYRLSPSLFGSYYLPICKCTYWYDINNSIVTAANDGNSASNSDRLNNTVKDYHKDKKSDSGCYVANDSRWSIVQCFANEYLPGARKHNRSSLWKRWRWKKMSSFGKALLIYCIFSISINVTASQDIDALQTTTRLTASQPNEDAFIMSPGEGKLVNYFIDYNRNII